MAAEDRRPKERLERLAWLEPRRLVGQPALDVDEPRRVELLTPVQRPRGSCKLSYTLPVPGPVALVGAGEFLPVMHEFDAGLLAATGRPRPRVAILPTASFPDGEAVFQRWAAMGVAHFGSLGAEVEPVLVRDRSEADDPAAAQALGEADLIYVSGGKPGHLIRVLDGSAVGRAILDAHTRGAVLAGCSAGAMVLADHAFDSRVRFLPWLLRWRDGLGFVPGASVVPHYDAWPEPLCALIAFQAPPGSIVLGIDEDTAVVGRDGTWQVHGRSRVTVWRGRHRDRYRAGETFRLNALAAVD